MSTFSHKASKYILPQVEGILFSQYELITSLRMIQYVLLGWISIFSYMLIKYRPTSWMGTKFYGLCEQLSQVERIPLLTGFTNTFSQVEWVSFVIDWMSSFFYGRRNVFNLREGWGEREYKRRLSFSPHTGWMKTLSHRLNDYLIIQAHCERLLSSSSISHRLEPVWSTGWISIIPHERD